MVIVFRLIVMLMFRNLRIILSFLFRFSCLFEKKIDVRKMVKIVVEVLMILVRLELICCCF